ncbi:MAG: T9SS type A sorting domain-containing protein [Bacteroidetes bacterium]|nr:T9SS type A sorting domain-containing protein [Bacteroidota bacterium]
MKKNYFLTNCFLFIFLINSSFSTNPSCTFYVSTDGGTTQTAILQGYKFWQMNNPNYAKVYINTSDLNGLNYNIWLADENGLPIVMSQSGSGSTMNFSFNPSSPYNDGAKYTLTFCGQGLQNSPWTISPWFYMSQLPTLNVSISAPSPICLDATPSQQITLNWSVSGGVPSLPDGGWTNNIQLQWHQNITALSILTNAPVSDHTLSFTVDPSLNTGGSLPGSGYKISGSNPANTDIPQGYVFGFSPEFAIIECFVDIKDIDNNEGLNIYPSPAKDYVIIDNSVLPNKEIVSIFNLNGQLLIQQQAEQNITKINISTLTKGVYIIKINNEEKTFVKKLFKD